VNHARLNDKHVMALLFLMSTTHPSDFMRGETLKANIKNFIEDVKHAINNSRVVKRTKNFHKNQEQKMTKVELTKS